MKTNNEVRKIGKALITDRIIEEIADLQEDNYAALKYRIETLDNLSFELAYSLMDGKTDEEDKFTHDALLLIAQVRAFYSKFRVPADPPYRIF